MLQAWRLNLKNFFLLMGTGQKEQPDSELWCTLCLENTVNYNYDDIVTIYCIGLVDHWENNAGSKVYEWHFNIMCSTGDVPSKVEIKNWYVQGCSEYTWTSEHSWLNINPWLIQKDQRKQVKYKEFPHKMRWYFSFRKTKRFLAVKENYNQEADFLTPHCFC